MIQTVADTVANTMGGGRMDQTSASDIYVVLSITLIVWLGLFFYLVYLDRQVKKVKERVDIAVENEAPKPKHQFSNK